MLTAATASVILMLLVLGAALRPLVLPESGSTPPILTTTEIGFVQDMTVHHQQALIMVQRLDSAVDPTIRRLAEQIDHTQHVEIGTMLGWLRLADAAPVSTHPMAWMHTTEPVAHGHRKAVSANPGTADAAASMPGMASTAELDALAAARGLEAEILFLQLMMRHHEGGIVMAQAIDELVESGPVKQIARSMIHAQSQEVGLMGILLMQRGAEPMQ